AVRPRLRLDDAEPAPHHGDPDGRLLGDLRVARAQLSALRHYRAPRLEPLLARLDAGARERRRFGGADPEGRRAERDVPARRRRREPGELSLFTGAARVGDAGHAGAD